MYPCVARSATGRRHAHAGRSTGPPYPRRRPDRSVGQRRGFGCLQRAAGSLVWPALIERYAATHFAAVPGVYRQLLRRTRLDPGDLPTLRHGLVAGEALTPALWNAWREATGRDCQAEALGMSELSTFISGPTVPTRAGSPGRPQAGSAGGRPATRERVDHTPVRRRGGRPRRTPQRPGADAGLLAQTPEEAAAYRGEWFVTSDLVHIDDGGYVRYHGRGDDVMTAMATASPRSRSRSVSGDIRRWVRWP